MTWGGFGDATSFSGATAAMARQCDDRGRALGSEARVGRDLSAESFRSIFFFNPIFQKAVDTDDEQPTQLQSGAPGVVSRRE